MIVVNKTKGVHGFGVEKENVVIKPGDNTIDDALWAKAKQKHEGIRELLRDKKFHEKPQVAAPKTGK